MEQIRMRAEELQRLGVYFFVASIEAVGILFLLAKVMNYGVEQWNPGITFLLYILLVILFVLIFEKKETKTSRK